MNNETNLVNIGVKVDESTIQTTKDALVELLKVGASTNSNDTVILAAIAVLQKSASIENLTFDGFTVTHDSSRTTNVNIQSEDEDHLVTANGVKVDNPHG